MLVFHMLFEIGLTLTTSPTTNPTFVKENRPNDIFGLFHNDPNPFNISLTFVTLGSLAWLLSLSNCARKLGATVLNWRILCTVALN